MHKTMLKARNNLFILLQKLARSLLVPLVVISFAVLLDALGEYFELFLTIEAYASIYMPVVFTVGVAVGLVKQKNNLIAVYAILLYVVGVGALITLDVNPTGDLFYGIFCGIIAAVAQNKVDELSGSGRVLFLQGSRFMACLMILLGVSLSILVAPMVKYSDYMGMKLGELTQASSELCAFVFGALNRLLVPFGLHHLLNGFVGTQVGVYHGEQGEFMRLILGDPTAGRLMGGMYCVAMFGLPCASLAMLFASKKKQRKKLAKLLWPSILAAIFTGVTEPIEYLFIFSSPFLYLVHVVLSGLAFALTSYFGVRIVYGHTAGAVDYMVNAIAGANVDRIMYVGLAIGVIYFVVFYCVIKLFGVSVASSFDIKSKEQQKLAPGVLSRQKQEQLHKTAKEYVAALGGAKNIEELLACTTRLRLVLRDTSLVDLEKIEKLGALGVNKMAGNYLQIIVGREVTALLLEMEEVCEKIKPRGG